MRGWERGERRDGSEDDEGKIIIQEGKNLLDFAKAGNAEDLSRSITSISLLFYFRGTVWWEAGCKRSKEEGRIHIS